MLPGKESTIESTLSLKSIEQLSFHYHTGLSLYILGCILGELEQLLHQLLKLLTYFSCNSAMN